LGLFPRPLLGGLLVMTTELHFAEDSLPLHLLLERLQGLIDVVVANEYLHGLSCVLRLSLEKPVICEKLGRAPSRGRARPVASALSEPRRLVQRKHGRRGRRTRHGAFPSLAVHGIERGS